MEVTIDYADTRYARYAVDVFADDAIRGALREESIDAR